MRRYWMTLGLCLLTGCGSGSSTPTQTAGIPLSIKSPAAEKPKADPNASLENKAVTQLINKARAAAANGQPAMAIEALSQAIGLSPTNAALFRMRGDVYASTGENANAQADYSLAIQQEPNSAELYNVRGYFLMSLGATADAKTDFEKAIQVDPEFAPAFNNRGLIYLAQEEYQDAKKDFTKAIGINRKYADALNNRGFTLLKLNELDAAQNDLKKAVEIQPNYTAAWNNRGLVLMKQEKFKEAIDAFSEAIRLSPLDSRWLRHRRGVYQQLKMFEEAQTDARRIQWLADLNQMTVQANSKPRLATSWINRARHLHAGDEFKAAIVDFGRALQLEPANVQALNGRALALLNAGETRKAIEDCDVSLVTQASREAFSIRGDSWFALKNYDQAITDFEAAQRFDESVAEAYRKRAELRQGKGQKDLAAKDLKRAVEIEAALAGKLADTSADRKPIPFPGQDSP